MYTGRQRRLAGRQRENDLDCVALVPGPNMQYLCGLSLFMSERPVLALFHADGRAGAVVPTLELERARAMAGDQMTLNPYADEDGPEDAFRALAEYSGLAGARCAVESLHMRVLELRMLERAAPGASFVSLEEELPGLRAVKDEQEIESIRRAIQITEAGLQELISLPLLGLSERQIAARLDQAVRTVGADSGASPIVVGGPNSANPHAGPSDRALEHGDLLTIDCGVRIDGYLADITRTFVIGEATPEVAAMYEAVLQANEAGRQAVRAGVSAQTIDRAARKAIEDAGYGEYFIHRTGHGLGMEVHEPPYIVEGNQQPVEAGMVFTVEPGVYVPGMGGVRIEDDVVVRADDCESLTRFPRELMVIS
jgi:Xaa-Pro dipeptidase